MLKVNFLYPKQCSKHLTRVNSFISHNNHKLSRQYLHYTEEQTGPER